MIRSMIAWSTVAVAMIACPQAEISKGAPMTITARVYNRMIALPPDVEVEEGQEVAVIVPERRAAPPGWLQRSVGKATSGLSTGEIMRLTRGED